MIIAKSRFSVCCGLLALTVFAAPAPALAENPWKERFDEPELAAERLTGKLPTHTISWEDAEQAVAEALQAEGAAEKVQVILSDKQGDVVLDHQSPVKMTVSDLAFQSKDQQVQATLYFSGEGRPLAPKRVEGRYKELVAIPVLKDRLRRSEQITSEAIEWKHVPVERLRPGTITDDAALIGKAPRRTISPGRAIRSEELIALPVVHKGDRVTMKYQSGGIEINAIGEALEDGAIGETVRVRNQESRIVVQTEVVSLGNVKAIPIGMIGNNNKQ